MRHVEALTVVVALDRIEDHDWPQFAVEGVSVDRGGLRRAEDHQHATVLQQPDKVADGTSLHAPLLADELSGTLRTVAIPVVRGHQKAGHVRIWELNMAFQAARDVH